MMRKLLPLCILLTTVRLVGQQPVQVSFGNLQARSIGPAVMSGRISCIDGVHKSPETFYIGAANGGVWKTVSAGASFSPVFDEHIQSIGDLRIDQAHPDTVWVGTGEPWVRNSVSIGAGVYVSRNGGKTWELKGLEDTERISKVLVHPRHSATVYVAAQGHLWGPHEDRGVYKTTDFGSTWQKVMYVDENTGCADLTMHPDHPDTLIAAFWDHRRSPDFFRSGGPGSGLYRTHDGGMTWQQLQNGLPDVTLGRMAVEYAPSDPDIVYLTVEAKGKEDRGLYRSRDGGNTFDKINDDFGITVRPFYFSRMTVDPNNADKMYKCGLNLTITEDGGETFRTVGSGVHSDIHAIWVPEGRSDYVIIGTDGGGYRSLDGGVQFEMFMNLPLSQFYHISVDNQQPYHIYGGLQDNGSWYGPSQSAGGITNADWSLSNWGDGFYSFAHPADPNIIYSESQGGNMVRYDRRDGQRKNIQPLAEEGEPKYRFNWNMPIHLSPTNPERLYVGAQFLFSSEDRGDSWERISPDLTTNDTARQRQARSGGLSIDNSTAENNTTIYTIGESPVDPSVIWVGTDDGLLHVTRDGGRQWQEVVDNVPDLPRRTWCTHVEPSPHAPGTAYVTFDGHKQGDKTTYLFKTEDFGQRWTSLTTDDISGYAHVIRQDLVNPRLLFAGTEFGLFISLDDGLSWSPFRNGIPGVAVRAIAIQPKENALVMGTHGRGIFIIDEISPLRQIGPEMLEDTLAFLDLPPAVIRLPRSGKPFGGAGNFAGPNPPASAQIAYYMKKRHTFGKMRLEVYDEGGQLIKDLPPGKSGGINLVQLPLRLPPPKAAPTRNRMALGGSLITPSLLEGDYVVRITKGKDTFEHKITLAPDPKSLYSPADRRKQQETLQVLYDMTERLGYIYAALEGIEMQAKSLRLEADALDQQLSALADAVRTFRGSLVSLEGDFYVDESEAIREEISILYLGVSQYPGRPSDRQLKRTTQLQSSMEDVQSRFADFERRAQALNDQLKEAGHKPMTWPSLEAYLQG